MTVDRDQTRRDELRELAEKWADDENPYGGGTIQTLARAYLALLSELDQAAEHERVAVAHAVDVAERYRIRAETAETRLAKVEQPIRLLEDEWREQLDQAEHLAEQRRIEGRRILDERNEFEARLAKVQAELDQTARERGLEKGLTTEWRERCQRTEARLAKVPALVEALRHYAQAGAVVIEEWPGPRTARDALAVWEQE
jgi:hypothetical protein